MAEEDRRAMAVGKRAQDPKLDNRGGDEGDTALPFDTRLAADFAELYPGLRACSLQPLLARLLADPMGLRGGFCCVWRFDHPQQCLGLDHRRLSAGGDGAADKVGPHSG